MKVTFYHRKRQASAHFSIENIFAETRRRLAKKIDATVAISPFLSSGLVRRLYNAIVAIFRQGDVNHVTGDVNYLAILLDPRRTILTNHDCSFMHRTQGLQRYLLGMFWLRIPVARSRFVTTVSQEAKRDLLRYVHCDSDKIVVIYNAISSAFHPHPATNFRDQPRILQIGTAYNKNIERLAESLTGIFCHVVIIGVLSESQLAALTKWNIKFENLSNLDSEQVVEQYVSADIVVFASTIEGFGMPILEAQAIGRPVVTSNASSMPEVAGDAASFVDPFDVRSIRNGILRVINDREFRETIVQKGFENVQRFDQDKIALQYFDLYRKICP